MSTPDVRVQLPPRAPENHRVLILIHGDFLVYPANIGRFLYICGLLQKSFPLCFPLQCLHGMDKPFHPIRAVLPHILGEMRLQDQREGHCCMAEVALYALDVRTGTEYGDSVTVAQIMETSLRRTDFLRKPLEGKANGLL